MLPSTVGCTLGKSWSQGFFWDTTNKAIQMIVCGTGHYDCLSFLGGKLRQEGVISGPTVQTPLSRRSGTTTEGGGVLDPQLPFSRSAARASFLHTQEGCGSPQNALLAREMCCS